MRKILEMEQINSLGLEVSMADKIYSLGLVVSMADNAMAKCLARRFKEVGIDLPHSQFILLRALYYRDGMSQLEAANLLSKDAAAIKRTVDYLESKGLIERRQVRPLKNALFLTERGRSVIPAAIKVADGLIGEIFGDMPADKRQRLMAALRTITNNANNI